MSPVFPQTLYSRVLLLKQDLTVFCQKPLSHVHACHLLWLKSIAWALPIGPAPTWPLSFRLFLSSRIGSTASPDHLDWSLIALGLTTFQILLFAGAGRKKPVMDTFPTLHSATSQKSLELASVGVFTPKNITDTIKQGLKTVFITVAFKFCLFSLALQIGSQPLKPWV